MNSFKSGDFVYFPVWDKNHIKLFDHSGIIVNISNDKIVSILNSSYNNTIYNIKIEDVRPISDKEKIINEINNYYDDEIKKLQNLIKPIKREYYKEEIISKYCRLKEEIINTAKHMIDSKDDTDFENKLKALSQKKTQIFAIKCDGLNEARKYNGEVKYKIKELIKQRDYIINNLDKSINNLRRTMKLNNEL